MRKSIMCLVACLALGLASQTASASGDAGACCNFDGSCEDSFDSLCTGEGQTFHEEALCADADVVCGEAVPTVSEWGLIVMTLLGCTLGTILYGRRRAARTA